MRGERKGERQQEQQRQQEQKHRVTIEIVLKPPHPKIGASLHNEHAVAVREEPNIGLDFHQRDVSRCTISAEITTYVNMKLIPKR